MIEYIVKSSLCLLVLFVFYKVLLEGEKMHHFKRFYLLGSLVFSMVVPLITISYTEEASETVFASTRILSGENAALQEAKGLSVSEIFYWAAAIIYFLGLIFFGARFGGNLRKINSRIRENKKVVTPEFTNVLMKKKTIPHSFLRYIFLYKKDFERDQIQAEVLKHEQVHVRQKHTLDVLIIESLQVVFWFNPLLILFKISMQANHEFLADENVLKEHPDSANYTQLLFNFSAGNHHSSLASPFNYSLIKKRILMISKPFSAKRLAARLGLLIPVLGVCLLLFNNEIVAKPAAAKEETAPSSKLIPQQDPREILIKVADEKIWLNSKQVELEDFKAALDELTNDLSEEEIAELRLNIQMQVSNRTKDPDFLEKLNDEFRKTRLAKVTGQDLMPPAPPVPPRAEIADVPPPPAPPKAPKMEISREIRVVRDNDEREEKITVIKRRRTGEGATFGSLGSAEFYFNDAKVSRKKAQRLMKGAENIRIEIKKNEGENGKVYIYSEEE